VTVIYDYDYDYDYNTYLFCNQANFKLHSLLPHSHDSPRGPGVHAGWDHPGSFLSLVAVEDYAPYIGLFKNQGTE